MATVFVDAWRRNDPKLEKDAAGFWARLGILPPGATAEGRAKELAVLAYEDDVLVALSTLEIQMFPQLRQKFAFIREAVEPARRLQHLSIELTQKTRDMIEKYAFEHQDEKLAGMAAVYQAPGIGKFPISRGGSLVLIGYSPEGYQVRAAWFDHFRVPANRSEA